MCPHDFGIAPTAGPGTGGSPPGSPGPARALIKSAAFRLMLALLAALLAGGGLGYLVARAVPGPTAATAAGAPGGASGLFSDGYERGYHRGWREGYDLGRADASSTQPSLPTHALTFDQARAASAPATLSEATRIAGSYRPSGPYQADVYDCNDMAAELWAVCSGAGLPAFLVVGNTGAAGESFAECDHCWVVVFCAQPVTGDEVTLAVDPQLSLIGVVGPGSGCELCPAPVSAQYAEGFFYHHPAALREDLGPRW